jgi:hypothetical protein
VSGFVLAVFLGHLVEGGALGQLLVRLEKLGMFLAQYVADVEAVSGFLFFLHCGFCDK